MKTRVVTLVTACVLALPVPAHASRPCVFVISGSEPSVCVVHNGNVVCVGGGCSGPGRGRLCGFVSGGGGSVQTGVIDGGPLHIVDQDTDQEVHTGSLTCTIQVGANSTHAGTDAFTVTGPTTTGVVVVPETQASYEATVDENVYLCSQLNIEGQPTLYFDDPNDPLVDGEWSLSATANCGLAYSASTPGEGEFPWDVIDPAICPVLALVFPDGDIPELGWDCPPYGS